MFFFKYAEETTDEDLKKIAKEAPIIKKAYDELNRERWEGKDLTVYEERIMDLQKEEGILAQKLDEGRKEGKIEVAKNLLKAGVSIDLISQSTGLAVDEIEKLKSI